MTSGESTPLQGPTRRMARERADRALSLWRRCADVTNVHLLDDAITQMRTAVELTQGSGYLDPFLYTLRLEQLHFQRWVFVRTPENREHLEEVLRHRHAVDSALESYADLRALHASVTAWALEERFSLTGDIADIQEAVHRWDLAVQHTDPGDPQHEHRAEGLQRARSTQQAMTDERMRDILDDPLLRSADDDWSLTTRAVGHSLRFQQGGPLSEADQAVRLLELAADRARDTEERLTTENHIARILVNRFHRTGFVDDISRAIEILDRVVLATPAEDERLPERLAELINSHYARVESTGEARHIAEVVSVLRRLTRVSGRDGVDPQAWTGLCSMLHKYALESRCLEDIEAAVEAGHSAVAATAAGGDPALRSAALSALATALGTKYETFGDGRALRDAAEVATEAVEATEDTDSSRPLRLLNAGVLWCRWGQQEKNTAYFDRGLRLLDTAAGTQGEHRPRALFNGQYWRMARYQVSGSVSDLDAVIDTGQTHRTVLATNRETQTHSLRTLCFALRHRASRQKSVADFDTALRYGEELLRLVPRDDPDRPLELHFVRAVPAASRFELSGDPADLSLSIAANEEALENCSVEHGAVEICRSLCKSLRRRFVELRDTGDLWTAALHAQRLLAELPDAHPSRAFVLWDLACVSADLSEVLPDTGRLHAAIGYARAALEASPADCAEAEACRAMLTQLLATLGGRTDDATALDQAVAIGEESWEEATPGRRDALVGALWRRYRARSAGADLDRAIEIREGLLSETRGGAGGGADRSRQLRALAELLEERHGRADTPGDLSRSLALLDEAAELSDTDRPDAWLGISRLLLRRYRSHRHPADIERAIELLEGAIPLLPADSPRRGAFARQLLMCLQERGEVMEQPDPGHEPTPRDPWDTTSDTAEPGGHESDVAASVLFAGALLSDYSSGRSVASLDQAVEVLRDALGGTPAGHPLRGLLLSNLCHTLRMRFEATGRRCDLEEAIAHGRAATEDGRGTEPWAHVPFTNLSLAHHANFLETGRAQDLDEALTASRRAVPLSEEGLPRVHALVQLGAMLIQKHDVVGSSGDLDDAIVHLEQAAAWRGPDGERHPGALSEYSIALRTRYETLGTLEDLAQAVELARQSVASPNLPPEQASGMANNLGLALVCRSERFHTEADVTEAIDLFRRCVDGSRHHRHHYAGALGNLSSALLRRYELTKQADDLSEAARVAKAAVQSAGDEHAERCQFLSRLCSIHVRLYQVTGEEEALEQAAGYGRQAVRAAPSPHPHQALALVNLGSVLQVRGARTAQAADLREARDHLAQAMRHDCASAEVKAVAAAALGRLAARAGDWEQACEAYGNAIALREVSTRHEPGGDALYQLDRFHDLASDAAACHLARDDVPGAIESWEKGRAGLLARELDIRHPDLDRLESKDPEKAARLMRLLDGASSSSAAGRQAQREAADILTEVRQWDGFASFLRPPRLPDLLEIVGDEPLVLVTLSDICSYAVIIGKGGCSHVPLHDLTPLAVMERLRDLGKALASSPRDEQALHRLLVWLGESLVEPVLRTLRQSAPGTAPDGRLRWILSGWLAMLPVQAALVSPEEGTELVPALTLFSPVFSSSLQGLQQARAREQRIEPDTQQGKDVLAVALPTTPGLTAIPFAALEVHVLKNIFGKRLRPVLTGDKATRAAVMAELPASTIAHFACHGTNNPFHPTRSALMLHDHRNKPLTVGDLLTMNLPKAELAYLSACSTASAGLIAAEQALHPASAFQAAGYPTVIGTLWDVNDAGAAAVARAVYARIAEKGVRSAHLALSSACAEVYRTNRERPSLWAAYVCYAP